jgi:riboflavin synthase
MFTGLIETLGTIESVQRHSNSAVIGIKPDRQDLKPEKGASISINGVCLTHEETRSGVLCFTAVAETLSRTTLAHAKNGDRVNMEQALRADSRLDGHLVLGHVDGFGEIVGDKAAGPGGGVVRAIRVPQELLPLMAEKGSVAIDGISLTIAAVFEDQIIIALIPATLSATTMGFRRPGDRVNIECDVLARYVRRIMECSPAAAGTGSGRMLLDTMERAGF